ncbi:MAG: DUF448 domain-containing protein [Magnetococcus sp. MYC-9]
MPGKPARRGARSAGVAREDGLRSCAVTRLQRPKQQLLRFVRDPRGYWTADLAGRLPGRGLYVVPTLANLRAFLKRRGPPAESLDPHLERVGAALAERFLDGLGLARRAGCLRRGLRDVTEAVQEGGRPIVLLAADTAVNTRQKLAQLVHRHGLQDVWELLDRERFGLACGNNGPVAVLAVMEMKMADRVRVDALRWGDFCNGPTRVGVLNGAGGAAGVVAGALSQGTDDLFQDQ